MKFRSIHALCSGAYRTGRPLPAIIQSSVKCRSRSNPFRTPLRNAHTPANDPSFFSIVDNPPNLVKSGRKHGPGLIILGNNML